MPFVSTPSGRVWYATLRADRMRQAVLADGTDPTLYFLQLVKQGACACTEEHTILEKDISRTFSEHSEFQSDHARGRLRRVLGAYALRHTYCQGMSYIAVLLLQHLEEEEEAFWTLAALVESFLPAGYFTDDLYGACMDQQIAFGVFLPHCLPRLAAHFEAVDFPLTLIGVRWFLCLFAADMEPECTARLWDLLFAHGAHVLFAVALGLLAAHEERLLAAPDVPELFSIVRAIGQSSLSWQELLALTQRFPRESDVAVARAAYMRVHPPPLPMGRAVDSAPPPQSDVRCREVHARASDGSQPDDDASGASEAVQHNVSDHVTNGSAAHGSNASSATHGAIDHGASARASACSHGGCGVNAIAQGGESSALEPRAQPPCSVSAARRLQASSQRAIAAAEHTAALLDAERRALHQSVESARQLHVLLGGAEAIEELRNAIAPPQSQLAAISEADTDAAIDDTAKGSTHVWAAVMAMVVPSFVRDGLLALSRGTASGTYRF